MHHHSKNEFSLFSCLVLSCLLLSSLLLSFLSSSVFSPLPVPVFFLCLCLSLSLSPCGVVVVMCCVVLCCVNVCVVLCCVVCVVCVVCVNVCVNVCVLVCDTLRNSVCPLNTSTCVRSERPRVYRHHAHMFQHMCAWCWYKRRRFERTHGDVFSSEKLVNFDIS